MGKKPFTTLPIGVWRETAGFAYRMPSETPVTGAETSSAF